MNRLAEYLARQHDRLVGRQPHEGADCPDTNTWALWEDDLLSPAEREKLIEHLGLCPKCRQQASMLMRDWAKEGHGPQQSIRSRKSAMKTWFVSPFTYAAAACLLLAVGIALVLGPGRDRPGPMMVQAEGAMNAGQYNNARNVLDHVLNKTNLSPGQRERARSLYERSYVLSAQAKVDEKDYQAASAELSEAMARGFDSTAIRRLRGEAMMGTTLAMAPAGNDKLTALGYVGILERRSKHIPVTTLPEGQMTQALSLLRDAAQDTDDSPEAWSVLGRALLAVQEYHAAIDAFGRWTKIQPESPEAHNALGLAQYAAENYHEALQSFARAHEKAPQEAAYVFNAAMACEEAGRIKDALTYWNHYLRLMPEAADAKEVGQWVAILQKGLEQ